MMKPVFNPADLDYIAVKSDIVLEPEKRTGTDLQEVCGMILNVTVGICIGVMACMGLVVM